MALFNKNRISFLLKAFIGIACLGFFAQRLYISYSAENLTSVREIFTPANNILTAIAFLLMFLNWGIEVLKWRILTKSTEIISFQKAWQSVWLGVCIGNLTPGRVGEFAGRVLFFKPENRAKAATLHFISGITQLIITIVMGCAGLLFFSSKIDQTYFSFIFITEVILLFLFAVLLFRINNVVEWLQKKLFLKKYNFNNFQIERKMMLKMLALSTIRYVVFFVQFYLLLTACGVTGDIFHIIGAITITYLLLSTIPMISVIEVAIRAFVVVLLFGGMGSNDWKLSVAATLLWVINIVIPSIVGYIFLIRSKFTLSNKTEI